MPKRRRPNNWSKPRPVSRATSCMKAATLERDAICFSLSLIHHSSILFWNLSSSFSYRNNAAYIRTAPIKFRKYSKQLIRKFNIFRSSVYRDRFPCSLFIGTLYWRHLALEHISTWIAYARNFCVRGGDFRDGPLHRFQKLNRMV